VLRKLTLSAEKKEKRALPSGPPGWARCQSAGGAFPRRFQKKTLRQKKKETDPCGWGGARLENLLPKQDFTEIVKPPERKQTRVVPPRVDWKKKTWVTSRPGEKKRPGPHLTVSTLLARRFGPRWQKGRPFGRSEPQQTPARCPCKEGTPHRRRDLSLRGRKKRSVRVAAHGAPNPPQAENQRWKRKLFHKRRGPNVPWERPGPRCSFPKKQSSRREKGKPVKQYATGKKGAPSRVNNSRSARALEKKKKPALGKELGGASGVAFSAGSGRVRSDPRPRALSEGGDNT